MASPANPWMSVVMPTHERGDAIERSIRSVLDQDGGGYELVIVDDASSVPTKRHLEALFDDDRIVYHYLETNSGPSRARNVGIEIATGEFIAFLDDDDAFLPNKLETVRSELQRTGADVAYHRMRISLARESASYVNDPDPGPITYERMLVKNQLGGPSMIVARRAMLVKLGGFDESLPALEDYDLWLRLAEAGARFHFIDAVLSEYTRDTSAGSRTSSLDREMRARVAFEEKHANGYARLSPEAHREHAQKVAMFRAYRSLVGGERFVAATWFWRAARHSRPLSPTVLTLLASALLALASPRLVLVLQGRLKHLKGFRALFRVGSA